MIGQQDKDRLAGGARRSYFRSASWSDRSSSKPCPRPSPNTKGRPCLPPLQPLSICRRNVEEWPKAGSDDLGVWPHPPTPGARIGLPKLLENSDTEQPLRDFQFKKDKLAFFDKECSRISDHIYLGSDAVARNREILLRNGITHVLNCVGFVCPEYFKRDLVYKTLWLQDCPSEDITSILYDVFDYFEDVREQGGRVLVHCCQGVSRSTSLVIAYLMWREGQSFEDAFQCVKAARGVTNPNMGFAYQLLQCQKRVLAAPASPNSVFRMYRMAPHSSYDPLHLVPKMLTHFGAKGLDSRGAFIVHASSALYVWIGRRCSPVMSTYAKNAASQVVRYERVKCPVLTFVEGEEPDEFWIDLSADQLHTGERKVDDYDHDFELFNKALAGGVVPPVAFSGAGCETSLPARENGWGRLRRRLASGKVKELVISSQLDHGTAADLQSKILTASPSTSGYSSSVSFSRSSSNWSDQSLPSSQPSPSSLASMDLFSAKRLSLAETNCAISKPNPSSPVPKDDGCCDEIMEDIEHRNESETGTEDKKLFWDLYQWPSMDKVENSCSGNLDSTSVYIIFIPDPCFEDRDSGILYVWLGYDVEFGDRVLRNDGLCKDHVHWVSVGHNFLNQTGRPTNSDVQIVRQGEEPEQLLSHLRALSISECRQLSS